MNYIICTEQFSILWSLDYLNENSSNSSIQAYSASHSAILLAHQLSCLVITSQGQSLVFFFFVKSFSCIPCAMRYSQCNFLDIINAFPGVPTQSRYAPTTFLSHTHPLQGKFTLTVFMNILTLKSTLSLSYTLDVIAPRSGKNKSKDSESIDHLCYSQRYCHTIPAWLPNTEHRAPGFE